MHLKGFFFLIKHRLFLRSFIAMSPILVSATIRVVVKRAKNEKRQGPCKTTR